MIDPHPEDERKMGCDDATCEFCYGKVTRVDQQTAMPPERATAADSEVIRALAKRWGILAEQLVCGPVHGGRAERAYMDGKITTLRYCEKQLIEALADLRAQAVKP